MKIIELIDEDFSNYKKPTMTIGFPKCTFKCGRDICQNVSLANSPTIDVSIESLVDRYISNPITHAICFQGLEPFDSPEIVDLIDEIRKKTDDDIVIYSGYTESELQEWMMILGGYKNIIIKVGRYIPNYEPHFDDILGIQLASPNQYAIRL